LKDDTWGDIILGGSGMNQQLFANEGWLVKGKTQSGINENLFRASIDNLWILISMNSLVFLSNNEFLNKFGLFSPAAWNDILYPSYKD
jgi:hypothetical protein